MCEVFSCFFFCVSKSCGIHSRKNREKRAQYSEISLIVVCNSSLMALNFSLSATNSSVKQKNRKKYIRYFSIRFEIK